MTAHGLQVKAEKDTQPEDDKAYAELLLIFEDFIDGVGDYDSVDELIEELAYLRSRVGHCNRHTIPAHPAQAMAKGDLDQSGHGN